MRNAIIIEGAAQPGGHYSHAVIANGLVFVSGKGPRPKRFGNCRQVRRLGNQTIAPGDMKCQRHRPPLPNHLQGILPRAAAAPPSAARCGIRSRSTACAD